MAGPAGSLGPTGGAGPTGQTGPTGPPGLSGPTSTQLVTGAATTSSSAPVLSTTITSTATCPAGTNLLGGGYRLTSSTVSLLATPIESRPSDTTSWEATATNYASGIGGSTFTIQTFALCTA